MNKLRKSIFSAFPLQVQEALRSGKRIFNSVTAPIIDHLIFPLWVLRQCAIHRQKAILINRTGVLGDLVCTLPTCLEIKKRHPGRVILFLAAAPFRNMLLLSRAADHVYGSRSWGFSPPYRLFGLIETIYRPLTSDERGNTGGIEAHLIDDLAASCGITLENRQPRLYPPTDLLKKTRLAHGLPEVPSEGPLRIVINGGHTWPVREWDFSKWQALVNLIHAEYKATIFQFGLRRPIGQPDEYDHLQGVKSVVSRLASDELVALLASCDLLISIDSGPIHVAGAVGTPVVGLYGALKPLHFLPPNSPSVAVFSAVPCLFCHHTAPRGHWRSGCSHDICCMAKLDVETVFEAVKSMLTMQKGDRVSRSRVIH